MLLFLAIIFLLIKNLRFRGYMYVIFKVSHLMTGTNFLQYEKYKSIFLDEILLSEVTCYLLETAEREKRVTITNSNC